jgi:hypothetical protein
VALGDQQGGSETAIDGRVVDVTDIETQATAIAVRLADLLGKVPDDQVDLAYAEVIAEELELAGEKWLSRDLEHDLRLPGAPRVEAFAFTGSGHESDAGSAHQSHLFGQAPWRPSFIDAERLMCNS